MKNTVVRGADILLPGQDVCLEKWAVVAVDQYTSQPEYWQRAQALVGDAPSTLKMVLPEVYLSEGDARIPQMQAAMADYLREGILEEKLRDGYILVERATQAGARLGLMACVDLEEYDYAPGSRSLIRATEGTVLERVPPRVRLRRGAAVELPHVLMLMDDDARQVIEPLYAQRSALPLLYNFELMLGGGRVRGWKVAGADARRVEAALDAVYARCGGLFLAVGDGNHSLAAARAYWLELRDGLSEDQRRNHPARYALVEIENLRSPAIAFEPIHRLLTGVEPRALLEEWSEYARAEGMEAGDQRLTAVFGVEELRLGYSVHPLRALQNFLDRYLAAHPQARIDYIHGDETLRRLARPAGALGLMPCGFEKAQLFPYIRRWGVLPRKTFSMGHAHEKRYYLEGRKILPD